MRHSKIALAAIAATAVFSLAGCAASAANDDAGAGESEYTIAFVSGPLSDPFFPPVYQGAKDAAAQLGVKINYIPIDEADIENTSAKTMQAAIAQKPDAIVLGNFIPDVNSQYVKQAVAAGIPVYEFNSGGDSWQAEGAFGFVGSTGEGQGKIAGATFTKEGSKDQVCIINVAGNPYLQSICDALKAESEQSGAKVDIMTLPSADSTDQGKVTRDIGAYLQTNPDIDGVFVIGAVAGAAAADAVDQAGGAGKIHTGVLGVSQDGVDQVKAGRLSFLLNGLPYLNGYYSVMAVQQYLKYGIAPGVALEIGVQVVDSSNIDQVSQTYSKFPNVIGSK